MNEWITALFELPGLADMGHGQDVGTLNLGLGWIYYSVVRATRPKNVVVIGSFRGFAPMVIAKALKDNADGATVHFLDPSYVDDFWKDPDRVEEYFRQAGVDNIRHYRMSTADFSRSETYREMRDLGVVFIDGLHTYAAAKADYEVFEGKLSETGIVFLHDSGAVSLGTIYGYKNLHVRNVPRLVAELRRRPDLQVFDFHAGDGVAIVSRIPEPR